MGYFRMRRSLEGPIDVLPPPPGVHLVPFTPAVALGCREMVNLAYSEVGYDPVPFEAWYDELTSDTEYDPDLITVAVGDGDHVAGFCHCWTGAFVKDLVVEHSWRRRGLGAALLTRTLASLAARGARNIELKTDLDNVAAQTLYARYGFTTVERVD